MLKIVLLSSLSNQLSFLHYINQSDENIDDFFIFVFPPSNTLKSEVKSVHEKISSSALFWEIKKYWIKLFLLFVFKILQKTNCAHFYLSRPLWERGLVGSSFLRKMKKKLFSSISQKKTKVFLKNCTFFGDGFSLNCQNVKPFWLLSEKEKLPSMEFENCDFYASYSVDESEYNKLTMSVDTFPTLMDSDIEKSIKNNLVIELDYEEIFVFTGTTFSKSLRTTPDNEAKLYFDFIVANAKKNQMIIVKFHPNGIPSVNVKLLELLYSFGFNFIHSSLLDSIPIEFIYMYLSRLKLNKVMVTCTTTGSYFASLMNENFEQVFGFGEELISKYIYEDYVISRLEQEKMLEQMHFSHQEKNCK